MEKEYTLGEILDNIKDFCRTRNTYNYHGCCKSLTSRRNPAYYGHTEKLGWADFKRICKREKKTMKVFLIEKLALNDEKSSVILNKSCSVPKEGTYDHEERENNRYEKVRSQRFVSGLGKRDSVECIDNENDDTINEGIHHDN